MMNRIILIGNGFDLAHGLPTSYQNFITIYWIMLKNRLLGGSLNQINEFCSIKIDNPDICKRLEYFSCVLDNYEFIFQDEIQQEQLFQEFNNFFDTLTIEYNSRFFELINKAIDTKKWVDIECEYYSCLKYILKQKESDSISIEELNNDLERIQNYLIGYLIFCQQIEIKPEIIKECIRKAIYEPFFSRDISNSSKTAFDNFLSERLEFLSVHSEGEINRFLNKYGYSYLDKHSEIDVYNDKLTRNKEILKIDGSLNYSKHNENVYKNNESVPDVYLLPDQILFLNFNYTKTADLYISNGDDFKVNHIHGELNNKDNPIIFGYGDELDEDYKKISNLNDNKYLSNIKSIRYLETDNYRNLLSFIDSAPFQIYIMGHSCGNSDRTLLNTLFEHKNCVSIKPFYYQKADGTDNYIEIIQNISRNFNDMRLMRDRVVNKTYCRPLIPMDRI